MKRSLAILLGTWFTMNSHVLCNDFDRDSWQFLECGPFDVGYIEKKGQIDNKTSLLKEEFRTVNVSIWYPEIVKAKDIDSIAIQSKFPVILLCPGYNATPDVYDLLIEYIVSHGFIIASFSSFGSEYTDGKSESVKYFRILQLECLKVVLSQVSKLLVADVERIGSMGHSYGGPAVINTALNNQAIKAVVSLDGTDACKDNLRNMSDQFRNYNPINMTASYLLILANRDYCIGEKRQPDFFGGITGADAFLLEFYDLGHEDFAYSLLPAPTQSIKKGFATVCEYVVNFFKAYLSEDSTAKEMLSRSPRELGFPKDVYNIQRHLHE